MNIPHSYIDVRVGDAFLFKSGCFSFIFRFFFRKCEGDSRFIRTFVGEYIKQHQNIKV